MRTILYLAITLLLFTTTSCLKDESETTQALKTNNPLITDFDLKINEIIAPYAMKYSTAGVSVGIYKNNQTFYYGYGSKKKGINSIPDSETLFEIGSITKTFTALLMVDYLQSQGLSIEDPINDYLPSSIPLLEYNDHPIRIKHLLNHTSGLPRLPSDFESGMDINNPYKHYDSTKVYNYLKTFTLQKEPGEIWEYSNLGAGLAGLILERKNHKSFEQLLLEKICTPLELNSTKITLNDNDKQNIAVGYNTYGFEAHNWDNMNAYKAAGAIVSNAKDMVEYGKNILNSQSSILKNQIEDCLNISYQSSSIKMGLGWIYQTNNDIEIILHDGGTGGFTSFIIISKSKNTAMVFLFNNILSESDLGFVNDLITEILN
ncbi:MAG: class A beta-lactamase-related serine hydrolase [Bacteroidales bacterium]|nr:MAG: class A beta-lactamase-related serine hydrolase [Bacteroidales bacterium]